MTTTTTYQGPRIWKQLAIVQVGPLPCVLAYALPAFSEELDVDREADLRAGAIGMAMQVLPSMTPADWVDRPWVCNVPSYPTLLFSQAFLFQGMHSIN
jgi:hypothetical protein